VTRAGQAVGTDLPQRSPGEPNPPTAAGGPTAGQNNVFAKGLYVLEALVEADGPLSLSGLVERTGLPKTTVHRLVSVLVDRGWAKTTGRGYGIGYLPLRAAAAFETSLDIRVEAEPFLVKLRNELDETVHLATMDHEFRVVYLEKLVPRFQAVGLMRSRVGSTAPAYCTGVGKAMLTCLPPQELARFLAQVSLVRYTDRTRTTATELVAELEKVRLRGYALCEEEHEEGVACVAAAIQGRHGEPIAAISLSGPAARMQRHLDDDSPSPAAVREAASAVSRMMGGTGQLGSGQLGTC
jgi:DNA-binding IclR family transcriptional regulator